MHKSFNYLWIKQEDRTNQVQTSWFWAEGYQVYGNTILNRKQGSIGRDPLC